MLREDGEKADLVAPGWTAIADGIKRQHLCLRRDAARNLIAAGESLFGPQDLGMRQAARDMELDEDELNTLVREPS